jgi:hypothetical protein
VGGLIGGLTLQFAGVFQGGWLFPFGKLRITTKEPTPAENNGKDKPQVPSTLRLTMRPSVASLGMTLPGEQATTKATADPSATLRDDNQKGYWLRTIE